MTAMTDPAALSRPESACTLVCVHGAGCDASAWEPLRGPAEQRGWTLEAVDLPGHGANREEPLASVGAMARWLVAELDRRRIDRPVLLGHSMGSLVALQAAATAGARIAALAMLGTAWPMRVAPKFLAMAGDAPEQAMARMVAASYGPAVAAGAQPEGFWPPAEFAAMLRRQQAGWTGGSLLALDLAACDADADSAALAAQWHGPTLLLLGDHDRMTPPDGAATLQAALPQARTVRLDTGHMLMAENPPAVAAALAGWLAHC